MSSDLDDLTGRTAIARALSQAPTLSVPRPAIFADTLCQDAVEAIRAFEKGLSETEEVGALLAHLGQAKTVGVESISYSNPYLIRIVGRTAEGNRCELLQHMSQFNLLLVALPAVHKPARRIGFQGSPAVSPDDGETE